MIKSISIIGLGLIGGSIAKALRKCEREFVIKAFDREVVLEQAELDLAIDNRLYNIDEALESDLIFLCTPVDYSIKLFKELAPRLKKNSVLTDVCGVKSVFQDLWDELESEGLYFGGHPMTGKEKGGYDNSDPLLFENSVYIISEAAKSNPLADEFLKVIKLLGARITFLNANTHDKVVANVSHLPQLLSVSLVNTAAKNDNEINFLDFAAGGFRDMTRIASSDFSIWEPVIKKNKDRILDSLDEFINELNSLKDKIYEGNFPVIESKFESSRIKRDEIPKNTKGFLNPLVDIFVFVSDVPGVISKISTALFNVGINIKDIELLKIREGTGGTFRMSFNSESEAVIAQEVMHEIGFETKVIQDGK
ncbi:MAG: prephenate dehydrogenase/arogenate dehydrogenase family protein [Melioribacteraceae bacterium]|nr:prephenate dehydrogenase/arogenate dehydrogenase family protein [Melioribacteraceae bacterium]